MEEYSFLKYIKYKEKKYNKKIKKLEQLGGDTIDLKTIQKELLKLKKKIDDIKLRKTNNLIDPYDTLKPLIDSINTKITKSSESNIDEKKRELLNKISEINIALDSDPKDYTKIIASSKLNYIGERIDPEQITTILNEYLKDSEKMISSLKLKSLTETDDLETLYISVDTKILEYNSKIEPFEKLIEKLNNYIKEMESLFDFTIEEKNPTDPGENELIINVRTITDETRDSGMKFEGESFEVSTDEKVTDLISSKFLNPMASKYLKDVKIEKINESTAYINENIIKLHKNWVAKIKEHKDFLTWQLKKLEEVSVYIKKLEDLQKKFTIIKDLYINLKLTNESFNIILEEITSKLLYYRNIITTKNTEYNILDTTFGDSQLSIIKDELTKIKIKIEDQNTCIDAILKSYGLGDLANDSKKIIILDKFFKNEKIKEGEKYKFKLNNLLKTPKYTLQECLKKGDINNFKYLKDINDIINDKYERKYFKQSGGAKTIAQVVDKLREFEEVVRKIKEIRNKLNKTIKLYNIRYVQFFNFQKYIVNYVSLKIAIGGYSYYQYMSKGNISYYGSILGKLNHIMDKFDNYTENDIVKKEENKWFYGKHYFMIKILNKFFQDLYTQWDSKNWPLNLQLKTNESNQKYFFLFNIFVDILNEYSMNLPPVANYIRINDKLGVTNVIFNKKNKNNLSKEKLETCTENKANLKADTISKIHFEEIFDAENFKENENLSQYMTLSGLLLKGKSIMLLTYGYSGVGKTFTLFGKSGGQKGMLQSTLRLLGSGNEINLKAFELYGLAVPYKFYWKDSSKFNHYIYSYNLKEDIAEINETITQIGNTGMDDYLDLTKNYQQINTIQIDNFDEIIKQINQKRTEAGRIKETVNNPESSRSIMIFDFKIKLINSKEVHFVVMDLPGKENLFQTYCESNDPKFNIKEEFKKFEKNINGPEIPGHYNETLLRSMMFINPLWLAMIPETAKHFDKNTPNIFDIQHIPTDGIDVYGQFEHNIKKEQENRYIQKNNNSSNNLDLKNPINIFMKNKNNAHQQYQTLNSNQNLKSDRSVQLRNRAFDSLEETEKNRIINILGLRGLSQRALFTLVNLINDGNLFEIGNYLNSMLEKDDGKNYGYSGLEGVYINENILGLLQVLANKVTKIKGTKIVNVVCEQKEIYRDNIKNKGQRILVELTLAEEKNVYFVDEDEFFSQICFMRNFWYDYTYKDNTTGSNNFTYDNKLRRDPLENYENKPLLDWVNNYDYNKIFNIEEPPISKILKPYLDGDLINNIYLFFVVSNNKKEGLETCDKQIQLLDDTKKFMEVISMDEPLGATCKQ